MRGASAEELRPDLLPLPSRTSRSRPGLHQADRPWGTLGGTSGWEMGTPRPVPPWAGCLERSLAPEGPDGGNQGWGPLSCSGHCWGGSAPDADKGQTWRADLRPRPHRAVGGGPWSAHGCPASTRASKGPGPGSGRSQQDGEHSVSCVPQGSRPPCGSYLVQGAVYTADTPACARGENEPHLPPSCCPVCTGRPRAADPHTHRCGRPAPGHQAVMARLRPHPALPPAMENPERGGPPPTVPSAARKIDTHCSSGWGSRPPPHRSRSGGSPRDRPRAWGSSWYHKLRYARGRRSRACVQLCTSSHLHPGAIPKGRQEY